MEPFKKFFVSGLIGLLWAVAGSLLYVDIFYAPRSLSPTIAINADLSQAIAAAMTAGTRVFAPSMAVFVLCGLFPSFVWRRLDPRPVAPLAVALGFAATGFTNSTGFMIVVLPFVVAFAIPVAWAVTSGERAQGFVYLTLPASIAAVSLMALTYDWLSYFPLRELIGRNTISAQVGFTVSCIIAALPALWLVRALISRLGLLTAVVCFSAFHGFDANFAIFEHQKLLGGDSNRPTIILIVVDTLRADALSYRSENGVATPNIDRLAASSTVFSNAISASSWTFPAMTSIMTGLAPLQNRGGPTSGDLWYHTIRRPTIAEMLQRNGYKTRAIVGNHLLYRPFQVAAGFDYIDTYTDHPFANQDDWNTEGSRKQYELHSLTTRYLTNRAIDWVQNLTDEPSFLWLHYFDPHDPYLPPREYLEPRGWSKLNDVETLRWLYRGEVRFVDSELGRFIEALKQEDVYDNSIVILTSDHGESFLEHGELRHGSDLYQELLNVPLLIRVPGGSGGKTVSDYVPSNALLPTIMELLGLAGPQQEGWAPSLMPLIKNHHGSYHYPIVSGANHRGESQWSIVMDGMKYIYRDETGREEFYDLEADPHELNRLQNPPEEFASRARTALARHLEFAARTLGEEGLVQDSALGDGLRNRMKSLGYLQ